MRGVRLVDKRAVVQVMERHVEDAPEARLWCAVVARAVLDVGLTAYENIGPPQRPVRIPADDPEYVGSARFEDHCRAAGLSAGFVRGLMVDAGLMWG